MKHLLICMLAVSALALPAPSAAWDGFDAGTNNLVKITPDKLPAKGDTVDVHDYDTNTTQTCLVECITRNTRTIEIVTTTPEGVSRTLVMEAWLN